jgi:NAD(P)-dependent dehydrogenase (short-subunit alcohol dehydrogenase family)
MSPVALITGGQQGIGLGIAEALAGAGFTLALAAEVPADAPAVTDALGRLGQRARYFRHDLRAIDDVPALVDAVETALGPVDVLVSNAGVPAKVRGDMLAMQADSFDLVLGVNLRGTFFLAQEVARRMAARTAPHYRALVFVTSVNATMASIERAEYCISKAGAAMLAQLFAVRLAPLGIGVFEIRPGIIETPMTAAVRDAHGARIEGGMVPAGRWGYPADVGRAVLPLVRGDMAFATGTVVPVDGGLSVPRL